MTTLIQGAGDSIMAGFGLSSPSTQNWLAQTNALIVAAGKTTSLDNQAQSGTKAFEWAGTGTIAGTWYRLIGARAVSSSRRILNVVGLMTNDYINIGADSRTAGQILSYVVGLAEIATASGAFPLLCSTLPSGSIAGAGETARLANNAALPAICSAKRWGFFDLASVAGITYQDGTHPDLAGATVIAAAAYPVFYPRCV